MPISGQYEWLRGGKAQRRLPLLLRCDMRFMVAARLLCSCVASAKDRAWKAGEKLMRLFRMETTSSKVLKVLAVASGGGHWEQLMLIRDAFERHDVTYGVTSIGLAQRDALSKFVVVPDANRSSILGALRCFLGCWGTVRKVRPDLIITTGALPGLFCLISGRLTGARTIWIDSLANFEQPSMSGAVAKWCSTLCLTQWEHLSRPTGPLYVGSLI